MAYFKFTKAIFSGKEIDVYNHGLMKRDFTYIDDIVEGIVKLINHIPRPDSSWSGLMPDPSASPSPFKIYNIGNNNPVELLYFINILEKEAGREVKKNFLPLQPGDVVETFADIDELVKDINFTPSTSVEKGLKLFVEWYKDFYNIRCGI